MKKLILPFFLLIISFSLFAQNEVPVASNANTAGTLTVTSTVTYSNPYYYAVWINNPTGTFLRTLVMYGNNSSYYADLARWSADTNKNKTNATTGATKSSTSTLPITWNAKDQDNSLVVADGTYTVKIEMTSESYGTASKFVTSTFVKGTAAQTVTPANVSPISAISIKWVPVNTAINDVELEKLYNVYPNPAISSIYVTGNDIQAVEICSLAGKSILYSREQKVDVSALPKGMYLAVVRAKAGTIVKKIQKI